MEVLISSFDQFAYTSSTALYCPVPSNHLNTSMPGPPNESQLLMPILFYFLIELLYWSVGFLPHDFVGQEEQHTSNKELAIDQ